MYTLLALLFVIACVALGLWGGRQAERPWVAVCVAGLMVVAQFAVLMTR
jgi:quinol-cytochrome oxidoreductase complex cytochrome b subunit